MAFTERYVTPAGAGSHDGTSEGNAFTWDEMITDIETPRTGGYRYNVKAGTYSLSATTTITADATTASPNVIRGYKTNIGDLDPGGAYAIVRTNGGAFVTTNMPAITYDQGYYFKANDASFLILMNLYIKIDGIGTHATAIRNTGTGSVTYHCVCENPHTGSSACAIGVGPTGVLCGCDAALTGGSGGLGAFDMTGSVGALCEDCRVLQSQASGFVVSSSYVVLDHCVDCGSSVRGLTFNATSTSLIPPRVLNSTIYGSGGDGISLYGGGSGYAYTTPLIVLNSIIAGAGEYAIDNEYEGTADLALISINNTLQGTSGTAHGFDDWAAATSWNNKTPSSATSEFNNAGADDFRLETGAVSIGTGIGYGTDIGAQQSKYTLPAAANVFIGTGTYGLETALTTPTMRASDIANCEAGNVKKDVVIDDVTGTYEGAGGGGRPEIRGSNL